MKFRSLRIATRSQVASSIEFPKALLANQTRSTKSADGKQLEMKLMECNGLRFWKVVGNHGTLMSPIGELITSRKLKDPDRVRQRQILINAFSDQRSLKGYLIALKK